MDRIRTVLPDLSLDPKRIAGTSVAIALHIVVLMILMLPAQGVRSPPVWEQAMILAPDVTPVQPLPRPLAQPRPRPRPSAAPLPPAPAQPDAGPVETTANPIGQSPAATPADSNVIDSFEPQLPSGFAQISADNAPVPPYPAQALRRHQSGVVTLRVRVDAQGRPVAAIVDSSSGSRLLDEAALKFVLARWHFVPARQDGRSIEAYALVPIRFVIEK